MERGRESCIHGKCARRFVYELLLTFQSRGKLRGANTIVIVVLSSLRGTPRVSERADECRSCFVATINRRDRFSYYGIIMYRLSAFRFRHLTSCLF